MKKALVFYSSASGHGQYAKHRSAVLARLHNSFDVVDEFYSHNLKEGNEEILGHASEYDAFIVAGGDGTLNMALNALMKLEKRPVVGFFPNGTLGDARRNLGLPRSWSKALKTFEEGYNEPFDLVKLNDRYFFYMAAIGAYSDISYIVKRKDKKRWHRLAYYFASLKEAFAPIEVSYRLETARETKEGKSPFLLLLNGSYVGGFKIHRRSDMHDGKVELFLTPKGPFNGLLSYFFAKKKVPCLSLDHALIHIENPSSWCLDGEEREMEDVELSVVPNAIRFYVPQKGNKQ